MSNYGADANPNLSLATEVTKVNKFAPLPKTNVMQWTYPDGVVVQKYANKQDHTNIHVKFQT